MIESPSKDARLWALIAHLAPFLVLAAPIGSIIAPLFVYLLKKDDDPFIALHAKESLNFHISLLLYAALAFMGWFIAFFAILAGIVAQGLPPSSAAPPLWFIPLLFPLAPLLTFLVAMLAVFVFMVLAAMAANRGEPYRYPLTIRFLR
jgi:uncharacterized Tic20 family protein